MDATIIQIQKKKLSEMTDEEINISKYRALERRYNSVMDAVVKLEAQNELFRNEIKMCYVKMENAQKNVNINKDISMKMITDYNSMKQSYIAEISALQAKLKG